MRSIGVSQWRTMPSEQRVEIKGWASLHNINVDDIQELILYERDGQRCATVITVSHFKDAPDL